ncbi:MFS transporter [Adlercreutzia sp. ZJ154]|uniref:MFS transporter n=1 Tax=Adlercreutzia sp. ZJ154 TaxID=2709790 RepID=UPI0013EB8A34|nr:MFS transporter [Adlercreutzia sp. ZJ154]
MSAYTSDIANAPQLTIPQFIDELGTNKITWMLFILLGLSMMFEGYDYAIVNFALPSIQAEWSLNSVIAGSLSSWSLMGLVIGGVISGPLADKIGRKKVLVSSVFLFGLLNLPLYFAQDWIVFSVFRVLAGVGLGACIPIVTTCFSEWMPSKRRGFFITFGMAWMILGTVIAGIVGGALCNSAAAASVIAGETELSSVQTVALPFLDGLHIDHWRVAFFIGFLPIIYSVILQFFMLETPYYYASKGQSKKCIAVLEDYERKATGKTVLAERLNPNHLLPVRPEKVKVSPLELFNKKYVKATLGIWIGYFCGCLVLYGMNAFLPRLCGAMGYTYTLATISMAAAFIANILCGYVSDIIGRKRTVVIGFIAGAVCMYLRLRLHRGMAVCSAYNRDDSTGLHGEFRTNRYPANHAGIVSD